MNFEMYQGRVPDYTLDAIKMYCESNGAMMLGGFLTAVMEGDLFEAFGRADANNRAAMFEIVKCVYNEVPLELRGKRLRVEPNTLHNITGAMPDMPVPPPVKDLTRVVDSLCQSMRGFEKIFRCLNFDELDFDAHDTMIESLELLASAYHELTGTGRFEMDEVIPRMLARAKEN